MDKFHNLETFFITILKAFTVNDVYIYYFIFSV